MVSAKEKKFWDILREELGSLLEELMKDQEGRTKLNELYEIFKGCGYDATNPLFQTHLLSVKAFALTKSTIELEKLEEGFKEALYTTLSKYLKIKNIQTVLEIPKIKNNDEVNRLKEEALKIFKDGYEAPAGSAKRRACEAIFENKVIVLAERIAALLKET